MNTGGLNVHRCIVPPITLGSGTIDFGRCFLNYEYTKELELINDTSVPAKYELLVQDLSAPPPAREGQARRVRSFKVPKEKKAKEAKPAAPAAARSEAEGEEQQQEGGEDEEAEQEQMTLELPDEDEQEDEESRGDDEEADGEGESRSVTVRSPVGPTILYHTTQPKGIIAPKSVSRVPLTLVVKEKEEQECQVFVKIFGSSETPLVRFLRSMNYEVLVLLIYCMFVCAFIHCQMLTVLRTGSESAVLRRGASGERGAVGARLRRN